MTNEQKIEELEKRIAELEKRPVYIPYQPIVYPPSQIPQLPVHPNLHYHGQLPCYQNPCYWC